MIRNGTFKKPGIKNLSYYEPIPRTSDLLKKSSTTCGDGDLLISNFYIAPPTIRYDDLVEEILFELSTVLGKEFCEKVEIDPKKAKDPKKHIEYLLKDEVVTRSIEQIIHRFQVQKCKKDFFKNWLLENGHTGELIKVASDLNASTMDPFARSVLSEENIFFYLAYRAVAGNGISDAKGIAANLLDSLGLVKSFINTNLVPKVIEKENLNVSEAEIAKLKDMVRNRSICYFPGDPTRTIVDLIEDLKKGGRYFVLVDNYLNDQDKVTLPKGVDKVSLRKKMVDYLLKNGYKLPGPSIPPPPSSGGGSSGVGVGTGPTASGGGAGSPSITAGSGSPTFIPDNFQIIENVGPETDQKFKEAGILTFCQLAEIEVEELLKKLKDPRTSIKYDTIIKQAKMICEGNLPKLVAYQKELNKR